MKKSIASKVALAVLASASTQVSLAAPADATTTPAAQTASAHSCAQKPGGGGCDMQKCYGIAKKAMNDCGNSRHACAAQATSDNQGDEWINVAKGNCLRITGGSLEPKD
jgi:uncharacterized membrane protein